MQCEISQVADNVECFSASVQGIVSARDPFPIPVRRYILSMLIGVGWPGNLTSTSEL